MATQRNLFEEHYVASHKESGLTLPDVRKVAEAYGLKTFSMVRNSEIDDVIGTVLAEEGPVLCEINTSPFQTTAPKVQAMKTDDGSMISKPLEDMWPYLDEGELEENMICNRKDL
jgi:acetolactate synthase-1/2/3 large subunit